MASADNTLLSEFLYFVPFLRFWFLVPGSPGDARLEAVCTDSLLVWPLFETFAEAVLVLLVFERAEGEFLRLLSLSWLQIISVDMQEKQVCLLAIKFFVVP